MLTERTIFRGAFWFSVSALFERAMFFLLPIFIAPLGSASLGIFHLALRVFQSIVSFPTTALNIRYTHLLRQYIQDPKSLKFEETAAFLLKVYSLSGLLLGTIFLIVILFFAPLKSLAFLALAIPFTITNSYTMLLLRFLQRFRKIFIIQAIFSFGFQLLYMIIFIKFFRLGIAVAFAGQFLMSALITIAASFFIFDRLNLLGFFQKIKMRMFLLSRLSFANVLFTTFFPILDIAIVGLLFGFSTLGHYIVLLYLPLLMHKIPTTLFNMFLHVAAVKTHNNEDITQIAKQVFKWMLFIILPLFIAILLFPSNILSTLFHKSYVKDLGITQLLAIAFFVQSVSWTAERILVAKNKKILRVLSNYIFGSMFVVLSLIFAYLSLGILGIALAYLSASILDCFIKYVLVIRATKVFFIGIDHIKILFVGTISTLLSYGLFSKQLLPFFFSFFMLYFAILWVAGILTKKIIYELRKMIVKEFALGESNG